VLSGVGWVTLLTFEPSTLWGELCSAVQVGISPVVAPSARTLEYQNTWSDGLVHSAAMTAAMMLPLLVPDARYTAFCSVWRRRHVAMVELVLGYAFVWVVAVWLIAAIAILLKMLNPTSVAIALVIGIAAIWQLSSARRRLLRDCSKALHVEGVGTAAHWSCLRNGTTLGIRCVLTCWSAMLALTVLGHSLWLLVTVALSLLAEWS